MSYYLLNYFRKKSKRLEECLFLQWCMFNSHTIIMHSTFIGKLFNHVQIAQSLLFYKRLHRPFSSFSGTVAHISIRFVYFAAFAPDFLLCATPSSWGREMTWVRLRTSLQPNHPGKELLRWRQTVPGSLLRELSNRIGVIGELTSVGPVAIVT